MTENEQRPKQHHSRSSPAHWGTLLVTNIIKLSGVGIAVNEIVLRPSARESVIAFCALCVMGAQAAEDLALKLIDRMFSRGEEE